MTLVVNLYAGPGAGKSTTASSLFTALKLDGIEAELALEFAKDLTWERRTGALSFKPYVTAEQMYRVHRLLGQVEVVITDSPILLGMIYDGAGCTESFKAFIHDIHKSWDTLDILVTRHGRKRWSPLGRNQTFEEATDIDRNVRRLLHILNVDFHVVQGPPAPLDPVVALVKDRLHG